MFRSKLAHLIVALVGVVLLIFTVQRAGGWPAVVNGVTSVGWWFILVVIIGAARMGCRAGAWLARIQDGRLRFRDAFWAVLAGDTAGNLTPLGVFASEPTKVLMTRAQLSTVTSIASLAIENAFYTASVLVVLLAGTWLFLQRADVPAGLEQISEVILAMIAIAAVIGVWAARTRPAVLSRLAPLVTKLAGRADAPADAIREVESRIYGVLQWPASRILRVVAWDGVVSLPRRLRSLAGIAAAPWAGTPSPSSMPSSWRGRPVRHGGVQVRPVSIGHRRAGIGRRGASARPRPYNRRDARPGPPPAHHGAQRVRRVQGCSGTLTQDSESAR